MSKYIFYHIYCNQLTHFIVREQINNIIISGLYNKIDIIYCFIAGEENHIRNVFNLIQNSGKKFIIKEVQINDKTFERFTLSKIHKYIKPEDKFLYIHSKGIGHSNNNTFNIVRDWRIYMEYFLMTKHEKCLELLDTYDTIGVDYRTKPFIHYSGNFWWCKGSYFLTLPHHSTLLKKEDDQNKYYYTENYLGLNKPNAYCFMESDVDHYTYFYPTNCFIDKKKI